MGRQRTNQRVARAFIDLEATCDEDTREVGHLIEIGAIIAVEKVEVSRLSTLVRCPVPVSDFCQQLTGIDAQWLETAPNAEDSLGLLSSLLTLHGVAEWISWGPFDRELLSRYGFLGPQHIDLAKVFWRSGRGRVGRKKAYRRVMGGDSPRKNHWAIGDAEDVFKIWAQITND